MVVMETVMLTGLGVFAVALVSFFIFDWVRTAGTEAVQVETIYSYSSSDYCLASNTGRTAAVVQNLVSSDGGSGQPLILRFNLSRDLDEKVWDSDFNGDGRLSGSISGGLVFYLAGSATPAAPFRLGDLPDDVIVLAGSYLWPATQIQRTRGLHDPLGLNPEHMYVIPASIFSSLSDVGSNTGMFDSVLGPTPGGSSGADVGLTAELLRLWQATLVPADSVLPDGRIAGGIGTTRSLDTSSLEFQWAVRVNDTSRCWTVTPADVTRR